MNSEEREKPGAGTESSDELRVSQLLGGLKRVDAPANFERRVMARIAEGEPRPRRLLGMPVAFAYSVPLVLLLFVAVAVLIGNRRPSERAIVPAVLTADETRTYESSGATSPKNDTVPGRDETIASAHTNPGQKGNPDNTVPAPVNASRQKQPTGHGGSFDETLRQKPPIFPRGIGSPNGVSANHNTIVSTASLPAREVLMQIGISAEYDNGWTVRRVSPNSVSERSGIKVADVVIALGDHALAADTVFRGVVNAASIRINRNGTILVLELK